MDATMELARSGSFWVFAIIVVLVVMVQSILFFRLALKTSESVGLRGIEVKTAVKSGAIASIGPSLGILIVAISLMSLIGDPLTLMRIGIVGSAPTESMGASIAAESVGVTLGTTSVTPEVLSLVVWTLCLGGLGWLLIVAIFLKPLSNVQEKAEKKSSPKTKTLLPIIALAVMLGAFANFMSAEMLKGMDYTLVALVSMFSMMGIMWISNKPKLRFLKEWSLGIAIVCGLMVGYFV